MGKLTRAEEAYAAARNLIVYDETPLVKVQDLKVGDFLDLAGDDYADCDSSDSPPEKHAEPNLEFFYAVVEEVLKETPTCTLVVTSEGSFGFPPDHLVKKHFEEEG